MAEQQPAGGQIETTQRVYENPDDIAIDAERMAQEGWTIQSQTEREANKGCWTKFVGFLFRQKEPNQHVVTYQRTKE